MFETETVGSYLVRKLKWGHGPPAPPPSGYTSEKEEEKEGMISVKWAAHLNLFQNHIQSIHLLNLQPCTIYWT